MVSQLQSWFQSFLMVYKWSEVAEEKILYNELFCRPNRVIFILEDAVRLVCVCV